MRRVLLLALLAMALPMAALASSIDPTFFNTGTFGRGSIGSVNASGGLNAGGFSVNLIGTTLRFRLSGISISTGCAAAASGICTFASGTLEVFTPTGSSPIFTDSLTNGQIIKGATSGGEGTAVISADLVSTTAIHCLRCELNVGVTWKGGATGNLTAGNGRVTGVSTIPEPSTLGLLGTGLISLAGLARRKLKLPT